MISNRLVKFMLGLSVSGVVLACFVGVLALYSVAKNGSRQTADERIQLSNRIAFVGNDGNVWLAAPSNEKLRGVTTDSRGYRFPTWSPDGRYLAFIGVDDAGNAALYGYDGARNESKILFNHPDSAPFYIYWSPDGHSVTFLTQELSGLAMWLADVDKTWDVQLMAEGAPFYWVWSPEGDQVLMHVGGARTFSEEAHVSFLKTGEVSARVELELAPGRFQAPLWSADGEYVFYIAADEGGREGIYKTNVDTSAHTLITHVDGSAFVTLSPDDHNIAYLKLQSGGNLLPLGTAYIIDVGGENQRRVMDDVVVAMYWSPDGRKLALLTVAQGIESPIARVPGLAAPISQGNQFRWWIYHMEMEALELLTSFFPTLDFLQTVPYFDQYHLSLTFWSPDSRYLVVTRRDAHSQDGTVWVFDTAGEEAPRQIGEGTLAVWSWR